METAGNDQSQIDGPLNEPVSLSQIEKLHVAEVLAHTNGNKQAAARILGIDRTTLLRMVKRHNLDGSSQVAAAAAAAGSYDVGGEIDEHTSMMRVSFADSLSG